MQDDNVETNVLIRFKRFFRISGRYYFLIKKWHIKKALYDKKISIETYASSDKCQVNFFNNYKFLFWLVERSFAERRKCKLAHVHPQVYSKQT